MVSIQFFDTHCNYFSIQAHLIFMLLRIFKSRQPLTLILVPIILLVMWIPHFTGQLNFQTPFPFDVNSMPLYDYSTRFLSPYMSLIVAAILLIVQSFLIVRINLDFSIINERTFMPALFYILIVNSYLPLQRMTPLLIAGIILLLTLEVMFNSFRKQKAIAHFFNAGFLIGLGSLFYFHFIFMLLLVFVGLGVFRPFVWREWLVTIVGFFAPVLLMLAFEFVIQHDIIALLQKYEEAFKFQRYKASYSLENYIFFGYFALLLVAAIAKLTRSAKFKIRTRKIFIVFLWLTVLTMIMFFLIPSASAELLFILAIPVSFILTNYYYSISSGRWGNISLLLFILAVFYNQFILLFISRGV